MKKVQVILNEQHSLLPDQERILNERFGDGWEVFPVPADGWTLDEQKSIVDTLYQNAQYVIFASPVPFLLKELSHIQGDESSRGVYGWANVMVFHNDNREKKELPGGKIISVVAKEGWVLV